MEAILLRIFVEIDLLIHQGIAEVFKLIFRIMEVDLFGDALEDITRRIYGILGVLILFKIVISAIQYLVNPDKLTDKDKGAAGIIQRTIISIALLALVPTIFDVAKEVETSVAGVIPVIILGQEVDYSTTDGESMPEKVGSWMSFVTLKAFITEKEGKNTQNYSMNNFDDFYNNVTHGCGWLFADKNCVFDYNFLFSIAVGGFMLYILLSMGIDIAIRTIKLGILELLAPIPIASYINNQENFKAWYQNAFKVYADLFIRLIVIYFIVYVMTILGNTMADALNNTGVGGMIVDFVTDPFVTIYIIIGLLMFAKQAPKFICDILGIKSDGFGGIADMFKRAGGMAGSALSLGRDAIAGYRNKAKYLAASNDGKLNKGDRAKALRTAFQTGGASARSGFKNLIGNKGFKETMSSNQRAARKAYDINSALESNKKTKRDYYKESFNRMMGFDSDLDVYKKLGESARKLSDTAKSSIDLAASLIPQKMSGMGLDEDTAKKIIKNITGDSAGSLVVGFDRAGNAMRITADDLVGHYNSTSNRYEAKVSVADLMNRLEQMKTAKVNDYDIVETKNIDGQLVTRTINNIDENQFKSAQAAVSDALDIIKGDAGVFVLSHAKDEQWLGRGAANPNLLNSIQQSSNAYFASKGTSFAVEVIDSFIQKYGVNPYNEKGELKDDIIGLWFNHIKRAGMEAETEALAKGDPTEGIVKDIYDRYSDKK